MNYEITEEQIKELSEKFGSDNQTLLKSNLTNQLKEWFPEVFEIKLEVGKWYKSKTGLFCVTEINKEVVSAYGFEYGVWKDKGSFNIKYANKDLDANDSEVEEALTNEAKKRGIKEGVFLSSTGINNSLRLGDSICGDYIFNKELNLLECAFGNGHIFRAGEWAEIVKTYTKEEAEKNVKR